MKSRKITWSLSVGLLIILMFYSIVFLFPVKTALTIEELDTGKLVAYSESDPGESFELIYTHSIHKSPVVQVYAVTKEKKIRQKSIQYEDFAIGMPSGALFPGERFVEKGGRYTIENMSREFSFIDLSTGRVESSNQILLENHTYHLEQFIEPGSFIRLKVRELTFWEMWKSTELK